MSLEFFLTVQPTQVMTPDQRRLQQQRASANRLGRGAAAPSTASTPSGLTVSPAAARAPPSVGGLVPGSVTITPTKVRFTSREGELTSIISCDCIFSFHRQPPQSQKNRQSTWSISPTTILQLREQLLVQLLLSPGSRSPETLSNTASDPDPPSGRRATSCSAREGCDQAASGWADLPSLARPTLPPCPPCPTLSPTPPPGSFCPLDQPSRSHGWPTASC